ncbi:hypothetical protein TNCV_2515411 [Trichonephila clavipes]|nr:hypothetical protein TNCV_2515411 [Trichonephila clavipes]
MASGSVTMPWSWPRTRGQCVGSSSPDTTKGPHSDRGPRNSSWHGARGTPVVGLEHHTGHIISAAAQSPPVSMVGSLVRVVPAQASSTSSDLGLELGSLSQIVLVLLYSRDGEPVVRDTMVLARQ